MYLTNCTASTYEAITGMQGHPKYRTITRRTFCKHVVRTDREAMEHEMGYAVGGEAGLRMAEDWHVAYFKSVYEGRPCVGIIWSAIEYIFV